MIDDAFSASRQRMRMPTRDAGDTIQTCIDDSLELFHKAGGRIVDLPNTLRPNGGHTVVQIKFKDKIIYRFKGAEIQDTVESFCTSARPNGKASGGVAAYPMIFSMPGRIR